MKLSFSTFIAGLLFGIGLTISQMVNPEKVIAFLNVFGNWDPSLAFVMGSALVVTFIGYRLVFNTSSPLFEGQFRLPSSKDIDVRLVMGAALFGVGWGLAGLCPGPAIASIAFAGNEIILFLTSMVLTMFAFRIVTRFIG